jgi:alpha-L-fucosidase
MSPLPLIAAASVACLLPAIASIESFAIYRLGETGSLGGGKLPLDSGPAARHFTSSIAGSAAEVTTTGLVAAGSSAALSTAAAGSEGWYASRLFETLPVDDFAFGIHVRAAANDALPRDVFTLGSSNGSLKLSLASQGWAASAHNVAWIGATDGVPGSFTPGRWVHLAVVRKNGTSTFFIDGQAQGSWAGTPVHNAAHLSVNPGGGAFFHGEMDEARVLTFTAGTSDADILAALTAALPPLPPPEPLADATFPTVPGRQHVVSFALEPAAGQAIVPDLLLTTGDGDAEVVERFPAVAAAGRVPYRLAFTAISPQTRIRVDRGGASAVPSPTVIDLAVDAAVEPLPAQVPSDSQRRQIERRYGMFIHFGINTFHNEQWTDGSKPPSSYAPTGLEVRQWVETARDAGMRHIILTAKHHDGFCLWDSPWTDYDVAASPQPADVIAAAAAACAEFGIGLGIYYSLWDRHEPNYGDDAAYNQYLLRQLAELLGGDYGPICELWLDGGWDKASGRWPNAEIYDLAKRLQPDCMVSTNWSIGSPAAPDSSVPPENQREGDPIRYFPNDFRLGDPLLPGFPDPKIFSHGGESYYLPFESTITLSSQNYWFYDTRDSSPKPLATLASYYLAATAQDNILILNAPPDRSGVIREQDRARLFELRDLLGLKPGLPPPTDRTRGATGSASAVWENQVANWGPQRALDGNPGTRWASGPAGLTTATLEIELPDARSFDRVLIDEYEEGGSGRIQSFELQAWDGSAWQSFHSGGTCGRFKHIDVPRRSSRQVRLVITAASGPPSIWEFQLLDAGHAFATWRDQHFPATTAVMTADPEADPDGDGLVNRVEFTLGTDPLAATVLPTPVATPDGRLRLELPWRPDAGDRFAAVSYSTDLAAWHDAAQPIHAGVDRLADTPDRRRWEIDPHQQPRWFYRFE